jgi:hypothetical protein
MRPGFIFIILFLLLTLVYRQLSDSLGSVAIFIVQAIITVAILTAATWWRRQQRAARSLLSARDRDEANTSAADETTNKPV